MWLKLFIWLQKQKIMVRFIIWEQTKPVSILKLANLIGGKKIYLQKDQENQIVLGQILKIKKDFKWKPEVSFEEGVKHMLKRYPKLEKSSFMG